MSQDVDPKDRWLRLVLVHSCCDEHSTLDVQTILRRILIARPEYWVPCAGCAAMIDMGLHGTGWRCFHCSVAFCKDCAEEHFEYIDTVHDDLTALREAAIELCGHFSKKNGGAEWHDADEAVLNKLKEYI